MKDKDQNAAIQRGIKIAGKWKKIRHRLKKWDSTCVIWAMAHKLPWWLGHLPIMLFILSLLAIVLLGGLLLSVITALVWMATVVLSSVSTHEEHEYVDSTDQKFNPTGHVYDPEPYSINDE